MDAREGPVAQSGLRRRTASDRAVRKPPGKFVEESR